MSKSLRLFPSNIFHVLAIAMFRVQDDVLVFIDNVDDVQLDTELFSYPERVIAFLLVAVLVKL